MNINRLIFLCCTECTPIYMSLHSFHFGVADMACLEISLSTFTDKTISNSSSSFNNHKICARFYSRQSVLDQDVGMGGYLLGTCESLDLSSSTVQLPLYHEK